MRFSWKWNHLFKSSYINSEYLFIICIIVSENGFKFCFWPQWTIIYNCFCRRKKNNNSSHFSCHGRNSDPVIKVKIVNRRAIDLNWVTQKGVCSEYFKKIKDYVFGTHIIRNFPIEVNFYWCRYFKPDFTIMPGSGNIHIAHPLSEGSYCAKNIRMWICWNNRWARVNISLVYQDMCTYPCINIIYFNSLFTCKETACMLINCVFLIRSSRIAVKGEKSFIRIFNC